MRIADAICAADFDEIASFVEELKGEFIVAKRDSGAAYRDLEDDELESFLLVRAKKNATEARG